MLKAEEEKKVGEVFLAILNNSFPLDSTRPGSIRSLTLFDTGQSKEKTSGILTTTEDGYVYAIVPPSSKEQKTQLIGKCYVRTPVGEWKSKLFFRIFLE